MSPAAEASPISAPEVEAVRQQLDRLLADDLLRTSKRSVGFLRYIVHETLDGRAGDLKERTIGVNVFGKALTYDTNLDHVVRTAASELRRRLSLYYGQEEHRDEFRILLLPGSYVPQFRPFISTATTLEPADFTTATEPPALALEPNSLDPLPAAQITVPSRRFKAPPALAFAAVLALLLSTFAAYRYVHRAQTPQKRFWAPLLETSGPVLIAVGDVPSGPPTSQAGDGAMLSISPAVPGPPRVPFADTVTIGRVSGLLGSFGKDFLIRREDSSSFADLRERPVVLIGAFNNEWSLQLTRNLRFTLAMDNERKLLYIRDREHPDARNWAWSVGPHPGEHERVNSTPLHDYALISRILDSETGHDVVVMGGLYAYGTQAAGEFLSSRDLNSLPPGTPLDLSHKHLQIVLDTVVTDGTPEPPRVVAVSVE